MSPRRSPSPCWALVALLPEYTIEAVLAWDAGASFDPTTGEVTREMQRVAANVTGPIGC